MSERPAELTPEYGNLYSVPGLPDRCSYFYEVCVGHIRERIFGRLLRTVDLSAYDGDSLNGHIIETENPEEE